MSLEHFIAFDLETDAFEPGLIAPKIVCGSWSDGERTEILLRDDAIAFFCSHLGNTPIVGANIFYDLVCIAAERPALLPEIFKAIEAGMILDILLMEALHDVARGLLYTSPTGAPFSQYSLAILEARYLGIDRTEEKESPDAWRLRYGELDGVPLAEWPAEAVAYPKRDAHGTWRVAAIQLAEPVEPTEEELTVKANAIRDSDFQNHLTWATPGERFTEQDWRQMAHVNLTANTRNNLHCLGSEMRAGLVLALACTWGMRTDPVLVPAVVKEVKRKHEESRRRFFESGIVRVRPCAKKKNKDTGVSEYERADEIGKEWLLHALGTLPVDGWGISRREDIRKAIATLDKGRGIRWAEDKGRLAELVTAAYQGQPPKTPSEGVSTARDTLAESGDELLEAYADEGENEKLLSTYVEVLQQGTVTPINPRTKTFLETGRVSYSKPNLQQLPRGSEEQNTEFFDHQGAL